MNADQAFELLKTLATDLHGLARIKRQIFVIRPYWNAKLEGQSKNGNIIRVAPSDPALGLGEAGSVVRCWNDGDRQIGNREQKQVARKSLFLSQAGGVFAHLGERRLGGEYFLHLYAGQD